MLSLQIVLHLVYPATGVSSQSSILRCIRCVAYLGSLNWHRSMQSIWFHHQSPMRYKRLYPFIQTLLIWVSINFFVRPTDLTVIMWYLSLCPMHHVCCHSNKDRLSRRLTSMSSTFPVVSKLFNGTRINVRDFGVLTAFTGYSSSLAQPNTSEALLNELITLIILFCISFTRVLVHQFLWRSWCGDYVLLMFGCALMSSVLIVVFVCLLLTRSVSSMNYWVM